MTALLICPSERSAVASLYQRMPLGNIPLLGQCLLEYWLSAAALRGVRHVVILAHERPELTVEVVQKGVRWGLLAEVIKESRELTAAEALLKYGPQLGPQFAQNSISVLDHFPGRAEYPLFNSYDHWYAAIRAWMPSAMMVDRVGINEVQLGVWMGTHSHVSPLAELRQPCWIGQHVFVGAGAIIGPGSFVENGAFVEPGAELVESWVGPDTFVGQFARIRDSLAWGSTLINRQTRSIAQVMDPFILCALRKPRHSRSAGWFTRLSELYARNKGEAGLLWKHLLLHKEG